VRAGLQFEDVEPARDLGSVDPAAVPVRGPVAAEDLGLLVDRAAVEEDLDGLDVSGERLGAQDLR
jgi:hypothetical protein